MKPPFPAYEIRRTDTGAVVVSPVTVLELWPMTKTATVEPFSGCFLVKTRIAFGDLVSTPEKASARVLALLTPKELTLCDRHPSAVAEPPQISVAGPAPIVPAATATAAT